MRPIFGMQCDLASNFLISVFDECYAISLFKPVKLVQGSYSSENKRNLTDFPRMTIVVHNSYITTQTYNRKFRHKWFKGRNACRLRGCGAQ